MVNTGEITDGDYLNANTCPNNAIVTIKGEGKIDELEKNGKVKKVLNLPVETNGKSYTYTPGFKALKALQEMFKSTDSKEWIGKQFQSMHKEIEFAGKDMTVLRPQALLVKA